jgi:hypothetical protein
MIQIKDGLTKQGVPAGLAMAQAVAEVTEFVVHTRAAVTEMRLLVESALAAAEPPRRACLVELEPYVRECLGEREGLFHGGGFVAAPALLADAAWWLEWFAWDSGRIQRLVPQTDPHGAHFFDYTLMPWYAVPLQGAGPTITGPYVDYLCTDDYTLTFTEAVQRADGSFAGVVGADVRVLAVEEAFLVHLRRSRSLLAIVNNLGRVVVSNSAQLLSGDLVREVDVPQLFETYRSASEPAEQAPVDSDVTLLRIADSELAVLELGPRLVS